MTKSRGILPLRRRWTAAEDARLQREYPGMPTAQLAKAMGRTTSAVSVRALVKFNLRKSAAYLATPFSGRLRPGAKVGGQTRFTKGSVPANKGLRRPGWAPGRMRETQFKKGHRQGVAVKLWKPIGTERISKDGYLERKVNNALPLQARWRAVHLVLWESVHGPLPPGYAVCFLNGDKADIRLDNLELITRRDLMARNSIHTLPPPLAQTVRLLGAVKRQINRRMNDAEKRN